MSQTDIQMVRGFKNVLFGGEGLFLATLTGPGKIWLQSMPIMNLAEEIFRHMPASEGGGDSDSIGGTVATGVAGAAIGGILGGMFGGRRGRQLSLTESSRRRPGSMKTAHAKSIACRTIDRKVRISLAIYSIFFFVWPTS